MFEPTDSSPATPAKLLAGAERREAVRYACTVKSLCQTKTARPEDFWWWGKIRDISMNGMGIVIRRPFEPGTHLVVEPLTGPEIGQPLLVRVIRVTKQVRGSWLLGCEFASQLAGRPGDIGQWLPDLARASAADSFEVP